jgi:hypothetical protein
MRVEEGAPVNTAPPVITAPTGLMAGEELLCSNGMWAGAGIVYSRQWTRSGTPIVFENDVRYVMTVNDVGEMIGCIVYAVNEGGAANVAAAEVGPIEAG